MDKLEPCPICKGEANLVCVPCKRGITPYHWWVACSNGCLSTHAYTSDHDAVEAWNKIAKKRSGEGEKYYTIPDDPKIAERSEE